jgi:hypothetical protein
MDGLGIWRARRDYLGRPALIPLGSLRSFKFAPGEFVELLPIEYPR